MLSLRDSSVGLEIDLMFHDLVLRHAQQIITVKFADTEIYRAVLMLLLELTLNQS